MPQNVVILGSTGSIGVSALDVISKHRDRFDLIGLSAHKNIDLLKKQIATFKPRFVAVTDKDAWRRLKADLSGKDITLLDFEDGITRLINLENTPIILNAIVGAAGLKASLETVKLGKRLALANKESMVIGGDLINQVADQNMAEIIPVDSEHSAIWQCLLSGKRKELKRILLTGSGGPFRELPVSQFVSITREQALDHPTWNMGAKITIDSATMMNKGLEIIEAVHLFRVSVEKIKVVIHPQSVVHSMVEFVDSSIIAQMSRPDMRLPILYAFGYPDRLESDDSLIDLTETGQLDFYPPDFEKFRLLKTAFDVAAGGGTSAAVFNAANEIAVEAFLNEAIAFAMIPDIVIKTLEKHRSVINPALEDILEADRWARETAKEIKGVINC